jgi:hypothetical protein
MKLKEMTTMITTQNLLGASGRWFSMMASIMMTVASAATAKADTNNDNRAPEVPDEIEVEQGNKVHFHGFGIGVQIYTWNGSSWGVAVPDATLFDDEGNVVASHFAGPTWESNSGSKVVGSVIQPVAIVDTNSIPWLRLRAISNEGPGIFANITFIQRVNTSGGKAPSISGTVVGQVAKVPYTADYFFYRKANH